MILRERALEIAITQLGVSEVPKGSNSGPQIDQYLAAVGIHFPAPWCMAFVYWCYREAANKMGVKNPLICTGGVMNHLNRAKPERIFSYAMPGDIFIQSMGKGLGHTGFVEKVDDKFIYTIEGNTNDEGSREGYEVCRRHRSHSSIKAYLRY